MSESRGRAPEIRMPEAGFPWGVTIIVVVAMVALAIFGSWGFATFGV